ncbi:MAG: hypothetical protein LBG60_03240 [Bifidobacteriaceae bacterium]|jgi:hypothetical protein|nr:hypothetical protein [Bifidobacteriaceae bacterium]
MSPADIRVAILGNPSQPAVPWNDENVTYLARMGFTAVQLNIAWSYRPNDEVLNLEDVVEIGAHGSEARAQIGRRAAELRRRAALAKQAGLRTILHVGAPFQGRNGYNGDALPQCVSDPTVLDRYAQALRTLGASQPDLDDLLVYTYDQDAWLCSEFEGCPRCSGVPLHLRVSGFINALAAVWRGQRPDGRLWWEPWELSAGQALAAIALLDPSATGLMLHSSIAEVISTMPVDSFVRNAALAAKDRGIALVIEAFLSSANEEVEPWTRLPVPCVTLRQVRAILTVPGVSGIKEYYGIAPSRFDINAQAAAELFQHPDWEDDAVLRRLAEGFDRPWLAEFWRRASLAYVKFPWDASWFARELGNSEPLHELTAAHVRGQQAAQPPWETPAWRSTRHGLFMATTDGRRHPWFLEDVGLRCAEAATTMDTALDWYDRHAGDGRIGENGGSDGGNGAIGDDADDGIGANDASHGIGANDGDGANDANHGIGANGGHGIGRQTSYDRRLAAELIRQRLDAEGFVTRARAYHYHLRETLLAQMLRAGTARRQALLAELAQVLRADLANQERELRRAERCPSDRPEPQPVQVSWRWVVPARTDTGPIRRAIELLERDPEAFLDIYFRETPDAATIGQFSLTSR